MSTTPMLTPTTTPMPKPMLTPSSKTKLRWRMPTKVSTHQAEKVTQMPDQTAQGTDLRHQISAEASQRHLQALLWKEELCPTKTKMQSMRLFLNDKSLVNFCMFQLM